MQQEAGNPLLPATALPKIKQPAAAKAVRAAVVKIARAAAVRRAQARTAAHAETQAPLTEAERVLLLKKTLTAKAPSKGNRI